MDKVALTDAVVEVLTDFQADITSLEDAVAQITSLVSSKEGGDPESAAEEFPTAVVHIKPEGVDVKLFNWEGVSLGKCEVVSQQIAVAHQRLRAAGLHKHRQEEMKHVSVQA